MDSVLGLDNAVVAGVSVKDAGEAYFNSIMKAAQITELDVQRTLEASKMGSVSDEDDSVSCGAQGTSVGVA